MKGQHCQPQTPLISSEVIPCCISENMKICMCKYAFYVCAYVCAYVRVCMCACACVRAMRACVCVCESCLRWLTCEHGHGWRHAAA